MFWAFVIGAASLAGFPLITAGFYSKDGILMDVWASPMGGPWLWAAGMLGALITAVYSFRLVFVVFFGEQRTAVGFRPGLTMTLPLIVLAGFSLVAGYVELPKVLGNVQFFSELMSTALPVTEHRGLSTEMEVTFFVFAIVISLLGILIAYVVFLQRPGLAAALARSSLGGALSRFGSKAGGSTASMTRCSSAHFSGLPGSTKTISSMSSIKAWPGFAGSSTARSTKRKPDRFAGMPRCLRQDRSPLSPW